MELLICGSGASEAIPSLFCNCELCREAWRRGGKDIRSRVAYQLGEEIRFDFGPDLLLHREKYQLHYEKLRHMFISHTHKDHYAPNQLFYHREYNATDLRPMTLYGNAKVMSDLRQFMDPEMPEARLTLHVNVLSEEILLPESGITVIPIAANHCPGEEACNYIVKLPTGFCFLLGTDSGLIAESTWDVLKKFQFDLIVLDATAGLLDIKNGGHMTAPQALDAALRMRKEGIAKKKCTIVANHFAHCAKMLHDDLEKFFSPHGILPAFDGMRLPLE